MNLRKIMQVRWSDMMQQILELAMLTQMTRIQIGNHQSEYELLILLRKLQLLQLDRIHNSEI